MVVYISLLTHKHLKTFGICWGLDNLYELLLCKIIKNQVLKKGKNQWPVYLSGFIILLIHG